MFIFCLPSYLILHFFSSKSLKKYNFNFVFDANILELAKLGIQQIMTVDPLSSISVYQAEDLHQSTDKTWIGTKLEKISFSCRNTKVLKESSSRTIKAGVYIVDSQLNIIPPPPIFSFLFSFPKRPVYIIAFGEFNSQQVNVSSIQDFPAQLGPGIAHTIPPRPPLIQ